MKTVRIMQVTLLTLSLLLACFAIYFHLQAAKTTAKADALQAEGARIHAEAVAAKAIEAEEKKAPSE